MLKVIWHWFYSLVTSLAKFNKSRFNQNSKLLAFYISSLEILITHNDTRENQLVIRSTPMISIQICYIAYQKVGQIKKY